MLNTSLKSTSRGFSLIELMVGLVIMGVLISVAVPGFQAWILNTQIRNAAETIQLGLQRARAEAVARNTNIDFALMPIGPEDEVSWRVQLPVVGGGGPGGQPIDQNVASEGSKKVLRAVLPGGATTVTFDNTGTPVVGVNNITSISLDVDNTVLPNAISQDLRVTINAFGSIRMCDPNVSAPNPRAC